jgi:hypothetical protein
MWLDHTVLGEDDFERLRPVRRLTVWAVKTPPQFFARLPDLEWLDYRGGSGTDIDFVRGCRKLRYLAINQVRGVGDLSALVELQSLEALTLYGLPKVTAIPSLRAMARLRWAEIGSMKGLAGLTGLLEAPALEDLVLLKLVGLGPDDAIRIANHHSIKRFTWFGEDLPVKIWAPVVELVGKPRVEIIGIEDWFSRRQA